MAARTTAPPAAAATKGVYYVYILTNKSNNVMYIGVTNALKRRVLEHKNELIEGFTKRYHVHKLVYFESFRDVKVAIAREKQLKSWKREKKDCLVKAVNADWHDLTEELSG